jgi:arylsulfatase A-like enzyme
MDRLAVKGQIFENALSNFHATTMSMASMMSGRTPSIESGDRAQPLDWNTFAACGLMRFAAADGSDLCLPSSLTTLAEDLRAAGYHTMGVVANELLFRPYGFDQGFDDWVEVGRLDPSHESQAGVNEFEIRKADYVNRAVARALKVRQSDRFFLYIHYMDVHDFERFGISYADEVAIFDAQFGKLLDYLEAEKLLKDAVVILTSDHGEMLKDSHLGFKTRGHFGNPSWEPVLRVPLIIAPPTDEDSSAPIRSQDLRGLINRIAGLEWESDTDLMADELFTTEQLYQTYRKGNWKSIWPRGSDRVFLFDLDRDPEELNDLATARQDVIAQHLSRVEELSMLLSAPDAQRRELSEEDLDRLRALGYLDETGADAIAEPGAR